jgi:hypothetical protein
MTKTPLLLVWMALSISLLGGCGMGLIAKNLQDYAASGLLWGCAFFGLAMFGLHLIR